MRERLALPRGAIQEADIAGSVGKTRSALSTTDWSDAYQRGRAATVEDVLAGAQAASAAGRH